MSRPPWLPLAIAAAAPVLFFLVLPPLTKSGMWDPYELNVADLSRRIAINLFGAGNLVLDGADNGLPHLNDLGRPQLPFSSVALGFRIFGLHEWAGRLPLALWGIVGVLATYAFVARLFDRRAGVYASIVLSTMPMYFVQARSMLGDVCMMAGLALAFGGLAVAVFDRDEHGPTSPRARGPWLAMGVLGLLVGFESRGALLGAGVPLLGVGLAWAAARVAVSSGSRAADAPSRTLDRIGDAVGSLSLLGGLVVTIGAGRVIAGADSKDMNLWVGGMLHLPSKYPTFDVYIGAIGHALAPWSAFLPFAFGRLLLAPVGRTGALAERESLGRVAILVGSAAALVAHGYVAARTDLVAFGAVPLCAVACAVAIRDFERGAQPSIAVGVGTLLLAAVLHHDFHELPEKAYQAFAVAGATFPESFKNGALTLWWVVLGGFALCAFLTWIERDAEREPFDPANYARLLRVLREAYEGMLALVYFATIAGASLAAVFVWIGTRTHAQWMPQMSAALRDVVLNLWWAVAFVPLGCIFGLLFACDVWLWAFGGKKPFSRASLMRGFDPFDAFVASARLQLFPRERSTAPPSAGVRSSQVTTPPTPDGRDLAVETTSTPRQPTEKLYAWIAMAILGTLLFLAIPVVCFALATELGMRPVPAAIAAIPSGVVFFLILGALGDFLGNRAAALALGGAVVGFVLCFSFYPALANQLSPKEVFGSYQRICPGSPLALLGVGGRTSAYYAGGQTQTLNDPLAAYNWLVAGGASQRRCLAMKAEELPKLNQIWREHSAEPRTNLPVLDARSSQILLATSSLGDDKNDNPLSSIVLSAPAHPQRRIEANMEDKLEVVGIDLIDERGRPTDSVSAGRTYHLKTYYRVLAPVTTEWEAFIHIDGYHRRHNGDHKVMNGKYPMSLWLPGDLLVDDHEFKLEPNFTPGTYQIYFGLFVGDTRLKVKSGPNDGDNRINGGSLRVL